MKAIGITIVLLTLFLNSVSAQPVFPGADEKTPSRAQYFSWINNTNEGSTEKQTLTNLAFFEWLKSEYGMQLDIYAFDAGAIDGAKFYGSTASERFRKQFPNHFDPIYKKAKDLGIRLGVWGGPDGFGNTPGQEQQRINEMVELCRKYEFELFKFDKVCGPLPSEKEDAFIRMMTECRKYSPDLILLNHRLGLTKGLPYATTFLWEGVETYTDCHIWNEVTAPHHRAGSLSRGFPPGNSRLTEDHGVCISSCLDAWDDELVLQAFNRNLILAPEIYGNPWLLRDNEFAKLARLFNLHCKYRDIMVEGKMLPSENYGPFAIARGNGKTRIITLRNLSWVSKTYTIGLDTLIGIAKSNKTLHVFSHHPTESYLGGHKYGSIVTITVLPFRTSLIRVTSENETEPYVSGSEYELVRNVKDKPVIINLLGEPGTTKEITLRGIGKEFSALTIDGIKHNELLTGRSVKINFEGEQLNQDWNRKLADALPVQVPADAIALYEATCFAADNNALEVRSLKRSGITNIPEVKAARDAFFNQNTFVDRGIWDKNLFDGDEQTSFYVCRRRYKEFKINGGCLRIDMAEPTSLSKLILKYPDVYALQPLVPEEGIYAYASNDLQNWEQLSGYIGKDIEIQFPENKTYRYIKVPAFPDRITEVIGLDAKNVPVDRSKWTASNLFADFTAIQPQSAWEATFKLDEIPENAYLCVAINGEHGEEGAYAGLKIDGKYIGAPDRSISYPSNTYEAGVCHKASVRSNYTYYFPLEKWMKNKIVQASVLVNSDAKELKPEVWLSTNSQPCTTKRIVLYRDQTR